jgi:hypothetical protein
VGRPRKSVAEHKANGTYRPGKHGVEEPAVVQDGPVVEVIERPEKLSEDAAKIWDELVELLKGSIRRRDVPALVELCRWIARADKVADELDAVSPTDAKFKALMIVAGIATDKVSDLTKRFGISPADRMKLRTEVQSAPVAAKVPTRPRTKLDRAGPPKARDKK